MVLTNTSSYGVSTYVFFDAVDNSNFVYFIISEASVFDEFYL